MKRIVVVDDVPASLVLLKGYLKTLEDVEINTFTRSVEAISWCMETPPDLIITDYMMPELDGLDFIQQIRATDRLRETPVIMVTSTESKSTLYEALQFGFADFLRSPIDRTEFIARARNMLELGCRQKELRVANECLFRLATTDALTGIPNRRHFIETASSMYEKGEGGVCCLAIADIDHFKRINDTLGHDAGDEIIRQVAKRIIRTLGAAGICGRLGGEEFSLFLNGLPLSRAAEVCERLLEVVRGGEYRIGSMAATCTISLGLAQRAPGEDFNQLLKRADEMLYAAKAAGRDRMICDGRAGRAPIEPPTASLLVRRKSR